MLIKPRKRAPLPSSFSSELVEPSAGTATAFISKLRDFPGTTEDSVQPHYFSGLRVLICLYDDGKPFLPQLVNSLHDNDASVWPLQVLETESIRQTIDALDAAYLARVVDFFLDEIGSEQLSEINTILRKEVWVTDTDAKN